jgi:hypothetical protein
MAEVAGDWWHHRPRPCDRPRLRRIGPALWCRRVHLRRHLAGRRSKGDSVGIALNLAVRVEFALQRNHTAGVRSDSPVEYYSVPTQPKAFAVILALRIAVTLARRVAVTLARRVAVTLARRVAVTLARRIAVTLARRIAVTLARRFAVTLARRIALALA